MSPFPRAENESLNQFSKLLLVDEARGWKVGRFRIATRIEPNMWEATFEAPDGFTAEQLQTSVTFSDVTGFKTEKHWLKLMAA